LKIFTPNFVHLFVRVLFINVLIFSETTLRIRSWHNIKRLVRIMRLHIVICSVMLRSSFQTIISKFTGKKLEVEPIKLIRKSTDVHDR